MMSRIPSFLIVALTFCASIESFSLADDPPVEDSNQWTPSREKQTTETLDDIFQKPKLDSIQIEIDSETSPHELSEPEIILDSSEMKSLPDLVEEIAGSLYDSPGRLYNAPGWYSAPSGDSTMWRPGSGNRFGDFSFGGVSADPIEAWEGLSITHGHRIHFLTGPTQTDMPPRVYDFTMGLHWFGEIKDYLWVDLSFQAGLHTDFEDSVVEGWRYPSHAVFSWEFTPEIQPVAGLRYFDRENLGLLPVAGLILRPDDCIRLELVYPEPRVAWRVSEDDDTEYWLSVSGRIGGGEWAIERNGSGLSDVATYNDYQIFLALDTVNESQSISSVEIGYAFQRELKFRSGLGNYDPTDTIFIRLTTRK